MFLSILYVAAVLRMAYAGAYLCPTPSQLQPCKCEGGYYGLEVICERALVDQVRGPLAEIGKTNQRVSYLTLNQVQLPNLPSNLLVGPDIHTIKTKGCYTSTVDENAFEDVATNLKRLYITDNPLAQVPSRAMHKLSNLLQLFLDDNEIQVLQAEAFKGLISLVKLSLAGNRIESIDDSAFVGIGSRLEDLDLSRNELTSVPGQPLRNMRSLRVLGLNDNKIASLFPEDFDAMSGEFLKHLNLASNTIRNIPARAFRSLKKLFSLNLSGNVIESIDPLAFEGNEDTLEFLILSYNRLEEIPTASLKILNRLFYFDLRGNDICKVRRDDFQPHGKTLHFIELQNNSLTYVDPEAFVGLDVLMWLTLQSNQLNAAPFETYSPVLNILGRFDIHDNPLHCDCNVTWLANWINGRGSRIVQMANETSCATPKQHAKKLLAKIPSDQLVCGDSTPMLPEPCSKRVTNAEGRLSLITTTEKPLTTTEKSLTTTQKPLTTTQKGSQSHSSPKPTSKSVNSAHGSLSGYGFTTVLQLSLILLITSVLGSDRLF